MKIGDKVRVARMSEYDLMVYRAQNIPLEIGRTGVVVDRSVSSSHGKIATVLMDDNQIKSIWCEDQLEIME